MPERVISTGDCSHSFGLVDRAEQRLSHRRVIEGRMQMVEAYCAHGCGVLGDNRDVAITGERLNLIGERNLSPVDLTIAECGHR